MAASPVMASPDLASAAGGAVGLLAHATAAADLNGLAVGGEQQAAVRDRAISALGLELLRGNHASRQIIVADLKKLLASLHQNRHACAPAEESPCIFLPQVARGNKRANSEWRIGEEGAAA